MDERPFKRGDEAFRSDQFVLYFQPQVDYETGSLVGRNRWCAETSAAAAPPAGSFVPLFERTALISGWTSTSGKDLRHIRDWRRKNGQVLPISVNISGWTLYDSNLRKKISDLAGKYSCLPPGSAGADESAYADNPEQLISVTRSLQAEGFT